MLGQKMGKVELPDHAVRMLRQFTDDSDRSQWGIGDVSAELVDEMGVEYGKTPVRQRIAYESGLAPETVRDREGMARFYSLQVREEYQVLSFHQLRACKSARGRWREYADWAVQSMDEWGGRPAPVAAIRGRVKRNGHDDPDPPWLKRWARLVGLAEMIFADRAADDPVREQCRALLENATDQGLIPD